jgi:hypothetical protein
MGTSTTTPAPGVERRIGEADARAILEVLKRKLADPDYAAVRDVMRSAFAGVFAVEAQQVAPDFSATPVEVANESRLRVTAVGPALAFCLRAAEGVKLSGTAPDVPWSDVVEIDITPTSTDSPDVIDVVLQSDERAIPAVSSRLAWTQTPATLGSTLAANKGAVHSGVVTFPAAAFSPSATLQLVIIPRSGLWLVHRFTESELRRIQ